MEGAVRSNVSVAGKQRRRSIAKAGRKFPVKDIKTKVVLPPPVTISKKPRTFVLFRVFAIGTVFFILMSTFALWRNRESRKIALTDRFAPLGKGRSSIQAPTSKDVPDKSNSLNHEMPKDDLPEERNYVHPPQDDNASDSIESSESVRGEERDMQPIPRDLEQLSGRVSSSMETENKDLPATESENTNTKDEHHGNTDAKEERHRNTDKNEEHQRSSDIKENHQGSQEQADRVEWYTREDFKEGKRPLCRISRPIVLSNGTILIPDWMRANSDLVQRCGLGRYGFYSLSETPGVLSILDIDADFALTIHLERFQEPTHVPSVFLTEHVLKSSFLFDTFTSNARPDEGVPEDHCIATETDSNCGLRPEKNVLKPGIFVPTRIEQSSESTWPHIFVKMLGVAHGNGNGVAHLNASSIVIKGHAGQVDNLIGTRFRSIMATDGMFRHLPTGVLDHSSFFSSKNGIERMRRETKKGGKCSVTVGISAFEDVVSGFDATSELKQKLEILAKLATDSQVHVKEIQASSSTGFEEHVKQMQGLNIFVAGSGNDMTSIGFLPSGSGVFELMPFGVYPDTHRNLAQALKVDYHAIKGKPQVESFKQCIESEIFNLRKKGKLQFTETPEWKEPLMKAWEKAVGDFVMSGASDFDILTSEEPVKNYYSKHCALKQKIEVGLDEAAREIIRFSKELCTQA